MHVPILLALICEIRFLRSIKYELGKDKTFSNDVPGAGLEETSTCGGHQLRRLEAQNCPERFRTTQCTVLYRWLRS